LVYCHHNQVRELSEKDIEQLMSNAVDLEKNFLGLKVSQLEVWTVDKKLNIKVQRTIKNKLNCQIYVREQLESQLLSQAISFDDFNNIENVNETLQSVIDKEYTRI
jgi:hypothetical protein